MRTKFETEYLKKIADVESAVSLVKDFNRVFVSLGPAEPVVLLEGLGQRARNLKGVKIYQVLPLNASSYLQPEFQENIEHISLFAGKPVRNLINEGYAQAIPCHFHDMPYLIRDYLPIDVFMGTVSSMDEHGYFSLGVSVDCSLAALKKAKTVILEVNPNMPRTLGRGLVHISEVDSLIESNRSLPELVAEALTSEDIRNGGNASGILYQCSLDYWAKPEDGFHQCYYRS